MCSHAPTIPTNGSDKPFPELWQVQRGSDKLNSHCATFFLSSGFKAKLSQNHRAETLVDSTHSMQYGSQHAAHTADSLLLHPSLPAFAFQHEFLEPLFSWVFLPAYIGDLGSVSVFSWSWCRMGVCSDAEPRFAHVGIPTLRSVLHGWTQSCWYQGKAEQVDLLPTKFGNAEWHGRWRNKEPGCYFHILSTLSKLGSRCNARIQRDVTSDQGSTDVVSPKINSTT